MGNIKIKDKKKFLLFFSIVITIVVTIITILFNIIIQKNQNRVSKAYEESQHKSPQSKIVDINKYSQTENVEDETINVYVQAIYKITNIENVDWLYSVMNKNFLKRNNLNEDNFKKYVLDNEYVGISISSISMNSCPQRDGSYVYRFKCCRENKTEFYINLISTNLFDYIVDFSQDTIPTKDLGEYMYYDSDYNIKFEVTELERKDDLISYQLKVINEGENEVEFYLNSITDMSLEIENNSGTKIDGNVKQASSVLTSRKYVIAKDSYFIKKMYFSLGMEYHSKVKGMIFYNVRIEDVYKNIRITF